MNRKKIVKGICEALFIIGFVMFGYGLYLIYQPAMLIVCGGILVYTFMPKGVKTNEPDK